ncbi:hypothetical protein DK843_03245 [Chromobacterium phragmitis]|uniref:Uncharacterized protein n=1 Tax=Chromobacterium phragmitis TaxID=2202141 RepID=A0A344UDR6_9NEIS|nr:hypothetical protein DK843_03245 [Chromobacterium phragmitis]
MDCGWFFALLLWLLAVEEEVVVQVALRRLTLILKILLWCRLLKIEKLLVCSISQAILGLWMLMERLVVVNMYRVILLEMVSMKLYFQLVQSLHF